MAPFHAIRGTDLTDSQILKEELASQELLETTLLTSGAIELLMLQKYGQRRPRGLASHNKSSQRSPEARLELGSLFTSMVILTLISIK